MSEEDKKFLAIVKEDLYVVDKGNLVMPLLFQKSNLYMPDNRMAIYTRSKRTLDRLCLLLEKLKDCIKAMENLFLTQSLNQSRG